MNSQTARLQTLTVDPAPPVRWARQFTPALLTHDTPGKVALRVSADGRWTFASAVVDRADGLSDVDFQEAAQGVFLRLLTAVRGARTPHALRFWSHLPRIHQPAQRHGIDRYMVFNAGRFAAFSEVFGEQNTREGLIPTASAVGHTGRDLVVHLLAGDRPGTPVENPRQVPAYRYSARYGPTPPSFARATRIQGPQDQTLLLVGGTASVVGEASIHPGDLPAQLDQTVHNLALLVAAAQQPGSAQDHAAGQGNSPDPAAALACYTEARVYYVRPEDLRWLQRELPRRLGGHVRFEWLRADLCRDDLLVEIEGLAAWEGHHRA